MDAMQLHHYPIVALIGCAAAALLGSVSPYLDPGYAEMRRMMALEHCLRADGLASTDLASLETAVLFANANGDRVRICPSGYPGGRPATADTATEILLRLSDPALLPVPIAGL